MKSPFERCADEYHAHRPEYPEELFDYLIERFRLHAGSQIVDVGAGTGKGSLPLARRGLAVTAVELSQAMIEKGQETAKILGLKQTFCEGTAEQTGLPDACADLVLVAQAFHWFQADAALKEIHRVVKPHGGLALFWNNRDLAAAEYLSLVEDLIKKYNPQYHGVVYRTKPWADIITSGRLFGNLSYKTFHHSRQITVDGFVGLTRSFSYVRNPLTTDELASFEQELRAQLARYAADGVLPLPYVTELWCVGRVS